MKLDLFSQIVSWSENTTNDQLLYPVPNGSAAGKFKDFAKAQTTPDRNVVCDQILFVQLFINHYFLFAWAVL